MDAPGGPSAGPARRMGPPLPTGGQARGRPGAWAHAFDGGPDARGPPDRPSSMLRRAGLGTGLPALPASTVGVAVAGAWPELRDPLVDLLLGLVPQDAVALLDLA